MWKMTPRISKLRTPSTIMGADLMRSIENDKVILIEYVRYVLNPCLEGVEIEIVIGICLERSLFSVHDSMTCFEDNWTRRISQYFGCFLTVNLFKFFQYGQVHLISRHHISNDTAAENLHLLLHTSEAFTILYTSIHVASTFRVWLIHAILNNKRSSTINSSVNFDISTSLILTFSANAQFDTIFPVQKRAC